MSDNSRSSRRDARRGLLLVALAVASCGYWTLEPSDMLDVIDVTVTQPSPRVGETTVIEATPLDGDGVPMAGLDCRFESSHESRLTLFPDVGFLTTGTAVDSGTVTVTVRCWSKKKDVVIVVRQPFVTLSILMLGDGSGTVVMDPPDGIVERGSIIAATATPAPGSTFVGWSGACTAAGNASQCQRTLPSNLTAIATFALIP